MATKKRYLGQESIQEERDPVDNNGEPLISVKEIAAILGRSEQTIRKIQDEIPHYVVGKSYMFSPKEVLNYLKHNQRVVKDDTPETNDKPEPELEPELEPKPESKIDNKPTKDTSNSDAHEKTSKDTHKTKSEQITPKSIKKTTKNEDEW